MTQEKPAQTMPTARPGPSRIVNAEFSAAAKGAVELPPPTQIEIAFAGRSNVGKSSLLNKLMNRRNLARTSSTPGCTRQINFFSVRVSSGMNLHLVDLPGYGYAKLSREISAEWPKFIEPYLQERETLALSIVLIDANVPAQAPDHHLIDFLRGAGRDFLVVATKADKLSGNKLRGALATLAKEHDIDTLLPYSTRTDDGRAELWREIRSRVERR